MKNIKNIFLSAVGLLIGFSSCSDEFLKDKKDYNRMTTIDVYSDRQQATAVFATITSKYCQDTTLLFAALIL